MHSSEWLYPTQPLCTLSQAYMENHETPPPSNPTQDSSTYFTTFQKNTSFPIYPHIQPFQHDLSPKTSSHSNNSLNSNSMTAAEGKEAKASASDLRHKRLLSNRESARKTRLQRKKQIEELQSQNNKLTTTNHKVTEELINLTQCINKIFQENAQLKEENSMLRSFIASQKTPLGDLEEVGFSICLREECSNPSILDSVNLIN